MSNIRVKSILNRLKSNKHSTIDTNTQNIGLCTTNPSIFRQFQIQGNNFQENYVKCCCFALDYSNISNKQLKTCSTITPRKQNHSQKQIKLKKFKVFGLANNSSSNPKMRDNFDNLLQLGIEKKNIGKKAFNIQSNTKKRNSIKTESNILKEQSFSQRVHSNYHLRCLSDERKRQYFHYSKTKLSIQNEKKQSKSKYRLQLPKNLIFGQNFHKSRTPKSLPQTKGHEQLDICPWRTDNLPKFSQF